ncbi:hypothetical protein D3C87_1271340 [compost metagenome]
MKKIVLGTLMAVLVSTSFAQAMSETTISESSLPAETLRFRCDDGVVRAEEYFENGQTEDEVGFLSLSQAALQSCKLYAAKAGGFDEVAVFVSAGKKLCKQSSDQRSDLHHGLCILKVSQAVRVIVL